jgi:azurin
MRLLKISMFLIFISPLVCIAQQEDGEASSTKNADAKTEVKTVQIYGIDNMKYVVKKENGAVETAGNIKASNGKKYLQLKNISVAAGEKVRIILTSIGSLPASAMSHNWILLKTGVDPSTFATAAMQAKDNEYVPTDQKKNVIAHTSLAAGGETVEVTFTAPDKKGEYDYLCSFPGHFQAGMKGKLIVR